MGLRYGNWQMFVLAAVALFLQAGNVLAQELKGTLTKTQLNQTAFKCKSDCTTACREALGYANEQGSRYAGVSQAIQDCLKVCELSQDLERHGSKLHCKANEFCVEACRKCIAACEEMKDEKLKKCINACHTLAVELSYDQLDQLRRDIDILIVQQKRWKLIDADKVQELKGRLAKIENEQMALRSVSSPSVDAYDKLVDEAASFKFELKRDLQSSVGGPCLTGPVP